MFILNKDSDLPLQKQLYEQVIVHILSGRLHAGDKMPPIRQLARINGLHHNTISRAYVALTKDGWLRAKAGTALEVLRSDGEDVPANDLDGVIDRTIRMARECGYSIEEFRARLVERLAEQPDHALVVSTDEGLRALMRFELESYLSCRIECCSLDELHDNPGVAHGAVAVCLQGGAPFVRPSLPKGTRLVSIAIRDPRNVMAALEKLKPASVVAIVSVSSLFLERAAGLLEPIIGKRHLLAQRLLALDAPSFSIKADLVFCDALAFRRTKTHSAVEYRFLTEESVKELLSCFSRPCVARETVTTAIGGPRRRV